MGLGNANFANQATPPSGVNETLNETLSNVPYDAQASGKGSPSVGSSITYPGQSGQPAIGMPNKYSNTVQSGDNSGISGVSRGKGI